MSLDYVQVSLWFVLLFRVVSRTFGLYDDGFLNYFLAQIV